MRAVYVARECAAGETAARVPGVPSPLNGGPDDPGIAAGIERLALFAPDDRDETRIAGRVPRGFRGNRRPLFQFAAAGMAALPGFGIDMLHDLTAVAAGQRPDPEAGKLSAIVAVVGMGLD